MPKPIAPPPPPPRRHVHYDRHPSMQTIQVLVATPPANASVVPLEAFTYDAWMQAQSAIEQRRWLAHAVVLTTESYLSLTSGTALAEFFIPPDYFWGIRDGRGGQLFGMEIYTDVFLLAQDKWITRDLLCGGLAFM